MVGRMITVAVAVLALAGCADNQPGDRNTGPGISNEPADLAVKVPALLADPCHTAEAARIFPDCGRFVTEVSNIVSTVESEVPSQSAVATQLQDSTNNYLKLNCGIITGKPTDQQSTQCPAALRSIGTELEDLGKALAAMPKPSH